MFTDDQLLQAVIELHDKCENKLTCLCCQFNRRNICAIGHPYSWKMKYLKEDKNETVN